MPAFSFEKISPPVRRGPVPAIVKKQRGVIVQILDRFVEARVKRTLRAKKGGVLVRPGQTEAAVDMARIAGLYPAGVICEIMNDDGTMARLPDLEEFATRHGLRVLTIADLIAHRLRTERVTD